MSRKPDSPRKPYDEPTNPEHFNAKPEVAAAYWELYQQGFSTTEIAKAHGSSRTAVHGLLKRYGYNLRTQKRLPFVVFNGHRYTLRGEYYKRTDGSRSLLHRDIWEYHKGKIPDGWDIHHINGDKQDNRIENLECFSKEEHTKQHSSEKEYKAKPIRRVDTGEVYESATAAAKFLGVTKSAIYTAIRTNRKCNGAKWEWV